jgi:predicted esterase
MGARAMLGRPTFGLHVVLAAFVAFAVLSAPTLARADEVKAASAKKTERANPAWCGKESEALPGDVCYVDGRGAAGGRRTLVIWMHGVIAKNTTWSWNHQHMLRRMARQHGIELLFPRGMEGDSLYAWPGTLQAQEKNEQALIDEWQKAKTVLEDREGRTFEEVFVFGFSSGAYFASSLAMRGRVDVDGYAVFAGGQPMAAKSAPAPHFAPVFVGVCANDKTTASHSRAFARSLAGAGIARMVSEQSVGHDVSDVHFAQALTYLRAKASKSVATRDSRIAPTS